MTAFADEVVAELARPLARAAVKQREQGRGKVSYIEGWHAIAEANRIFGFDGWTRETVMSECCHSGSYEKAVWENGRRTNRTVESYRCTYRARVRVTAGGIVREGSGHGHGFADNPGEAHESAEKEAETDAMKRALMTFGNPFGLALYDKAQAEVEPIARQPARSTVPMADDPFGGDDERSAPPAAAPSRAAPRPSNGHAVVDPDRKAKHDRAVEARDRIRAAIDKAQEPKLVDEILRVCAHDLEFIKTFHEPTFDALVQRATARSNELLASA